MNEDSLDELQRAERNKALANKVNVRSIRMRKGKTAEARVNGVLRGGRVLGDKVFVFYGPRRQEVALKT